MNEAAKYRANAELCRRMADKAENEQDKRAWLEMAKSWSFLTKLEDVVPLEKRDAVELSTGPFNTTTRKRYSDASLALVKTVNRLKVRVGKPLKARLNSVYSSVSSLLKSYL
jgi:hypothetical protein